MKLDDAPPSLAPDANPLAGLPSLAKPHYSWYRELYPNGSGISDNHETLIDYARITQSMPVVHGASQSAVLTAVKVCLEAIDLGDGNCSLGLNFSPFIVRELPLPAARRAAQ